MVGAKTTGYNRGAPKCLAGIRNLEAAQGTKPRFYSWLVKGSEKPVHTRAWPNRAHPKSLGGSCSFRAVWIAEAFDSLGPGNQTRWP